MGFLPVGPQGHQLSAAREKKQNTKIWSAYHPTAAPPKQTHKQQPHLHLAAKQWVNSQKWCKRWGWHKYHKFCCLCIHLSSGASLLQLHPSTHTLTAATPGATAQQVTFSGVGAWAHTAREPWDGAIQTLLIKSSRYIRCFERGSVVQDLCLTNIKCL